MSEQVTHEEAEQMNENQNQLEGNLVEREGEMGDLFGREGAADALAHIANHLDAHDASSFAQTCRLAHVVVEEQYDWSRELKQLRIARCLACEHEDQTPWSTYCDDKRHNWHRAYKRWQSHIQKWQKGQVNIRSIYREAIEIQNNNQILSGISRLLYNEYIVFVGASEEIAILDLNEKNKKVASLMQANWEPRVLLVMPLRNQPALLIVGCNDGMLYTYEMDGKGYPCIRSTSAHVYGIQNIVASSSSSNPGNPDERCLFASVDWQAIKLWKATTGECLRTFSPERLTAAVAICDMDIVFSQNCKTLGILRIDGPDEPQIFRYYSPMCPSTDLHSLSCSKRWIVGQDVTSIYIWNRTDPQVAESFFCSTVPHFADFTSNTVIYVNELGICEYDFERRSKTHIKDQDLKSIIGFKVFGDLIIVGTPLCHLLVCSREQRQVLCHIDVLPGNQRIREILHFNPTTGTLLYQTHDEEPDEAVFRCLKAASTIP